MNKVKAERKAAFLNSFAKNENIRYEAQEVQVRRSYSYDDEEMENLLEPQFKVMQVCTVRDGSLVQWVAY